MRRKALVLAALTACTFESLLAQPPSLADARCAAIGKAFGPHSGKLDSSLNICFQWAQEKVRGRPSIYASLPDSSLHVFGFNNIVYVQRGQKLSVISGDMSKITDIQALTLSQDGKLLAVLDKYTTDKGISRQRLLFFRSEQNGNVVPFSLNEDDLVSEAKNLAFSANSEEIFIILPKEIVSFGINDDSRSPIKERKPQKKKSLTLSQDLAAATRSLISKDNELVILNPNYGVRAYDLSKENPKIIWDIKVDHKLISNLGVLSHLSYDRNKKILSIFDSSGQVAKIAY